MASSFLLTALVQGSVAPGHCDGMVVGRGGRGGYGCASLNLSVGVIRGNVWEDGDEFLMVPYGTAKRFEKPEPVRPLPSDDYSNILPLGQAACMQPGPPYTPGSGKAYGVEDCLIMNIYKPRDNDIGTTAGLRPILLWIFGGDNTASEIIPYNATKLAGKHNAVVATVSYRLGGLGFAAFEGDDAGANNGMYDILLAAKWLQREAANLGADPARLTTFGESSGATDSQILAMSPLARGVVSGSIAESGALYAQSLAAAIENTKAMARKCGCDGIFEPIKACMQKKTGAEIVPGGADADWGPTVDGQLLTDQPAAVLAKTGLNPGVSVLWGGNTNDSATVLSPKDFLSEKQYVEQLNDTIHGRGGGPGSMAATMAPTKKISGHRHHARVVRELERRAAESAVAPPAPDLLKRALALYPPKKFPHNNAAQVGWFDSDRFLCNIRREGVAASKAARHGGLAFVYRFDWFFQSDMSCIADSNYHDPSSGSNHCDEMTFVMGQPIYDNQDPPGYAYTNCSDPSSAYYDEKRCVGCTFDSSEAEFSATIGSFWAEFARNGRPANNVLWPSINTTASGAGNGVGGIFLHPGAIAAEHDMGRADACVLWDEVDKNGGPF